jgi:hypothetical protein
MIVAVQLQNHYNTMNPLKLHGTQCVYFEKCPWLDVVIFGAGALLTRG